MQVSRHLAGEPELSVLVAGQHARLAQLLLDKAGFLMSNVAIKLCVHDLGMPLSSKDAIANLQANMPMWANCDPKAACWLAVQKPVIYLGSKTRAAPEISDSQLQRIVLHLLAPSLCGICKGSTTEQSLEYAWESLCGQLRIEPPNDLCRPLRPIHALGMWLSYGITSQTLKLQRKTPKHHAALTVWCDERSPSFWFYQSAINEVLKRYAMPPWPIATLVQSLAADGAFVEKRKMGRSYALCFKKHILQSEARSILGYKEQENSANLLQIPTPMGANAASQAVG